MCAAGGDWEEDEEGEEEEEEGPAAAGEAAPGGFSARSNKRHFVACALPPAALAAVWEGLLPGALGDPAAVSRVRFYDRRRPTGNAHFATVDYRDAAAAAAAVAAPRAAAGRRLNLATTASGPREVCVEGLNLPTEEVVRQFASLGSIVASYAPPRKLSVHLVYATAEGARQAAELDGKRWQGQPVHVRLLPEPAPGPGTAAPPAPAPAAAAAPAAAKTGAGKAAKVRRKRPARKDRALRDRVFEILPGEVKAKVTKLQKTRSAVLTNLEMVQEQLKKRRQAEQQKGADPVAQQLQECSTSKAELEAELERLTQKRKKLHQVLRRLTRPHRTQLRALR